MRQSFLAGTIAGLIAVIAWGMQLPIAADAFRLVDPFHITSIRYLAATAILVPIFIAREGLASLHYAGRAREVWMIGATGMSASPLLSFYGISLIGAEKGAVIVALQPLMMAMTHWALHHRRPALFTFVCIAVAFSGVAMVVTRGGASVNGSAHDLFGAALIVCGCMCWVVYTLGTERLTGWSAWRITVLTMIPGAVTTTSVTILFTALGLSTTPTLAAMWEVKWELAFLSFIGVLFSMLAWNFCSRRIGPLNSTLLTNLMPIVTFIYRAFQGYRFSPVEIAGAGLVVIALIANNVYLRFKYLQRAAIRAV